MPVKQVFKSVVQRVRRRVHPLGSEYVRYFNNKLEQQQALHRIQLKRDPKKLEAFRREERIKRLNRIEQLRTDLKKAYDKQKYWSKKSRKLDAEVAGVHAERYREKIRSLTNQFESAKKQLEMLK